MYVVRRCFSLWKDCCVGWFMHRLWICRLLTCIRTLRRKWWSDFDLGIRQTPRKSFRFLEALLFNKPFQLWAGIMGNLACLCLQLCMSCACIVSEVRMLTHCKILSTGTRCTRRRKSYLAVASSMVTTSTTIVDAMVA